MGKRGTFSSSFLPISLVAAIAGIIIQDALRPEVLLVGSITVDLVGDTKPVGGAVSYAAAALRAYGVRACVVTVAGPDANLSVFAGHELHVVPAAATLTFEHTYRQQQGPSGPVRHLRVTANPNVTLSRAHVPKHCQRARVVILGPLTLHDVDAASFLTFDGVWDRLRRWRQLVCNMAQGYQRLLADGLTGDVLALPKPTQRLMDGLGPSVSLFLSDVETHAWSAEELARVAARVDRMVVTWGKKGAIEYNASGIVPSDAYPVDQVVDTNGAGDTFATAYMLALVRRQADPVWWANWAAGQAVRMPQDCKPGCVGHHIEGRVALWGWRDQLQAVGLDLVLAAQEGRAAVACALHEVLRGQVAPMDGLRKAVAWWAAHTHSAPPA